MYRVVAGDTEVSKLTAEQREVMRQMGRIGGKARHARKGFGSMTIERLNALQAKALETRRRNKLARVSLSLQKSS